LNIDQTKFINLLLEKTNQKLSHLQNQVIILETQLQLATELNKSILDEQNSLKQEIEKLKKKKDKNVTNAEEFTN
jgi:hypothetical protein